MKRIAVVVVTATAAIGSFGSPANAHGPGYGYWGGYTFGYYRDYSPVGTYDGYIPVTHTEYTTYNDAPAYMGYRYRIVVHPAHANRRQLRW
ncbi:MAG: hypothetical protein ACREEK_01365 [Bradyrhizobium sp.]